MATLPSQVAVVVSLGFVMLAFEIPSLVAFAVRQEARVIQDVVLLIVSAFPRAFGVLSSHVCANHRNARVPMLHENR